MSPHTQAASTLCAPRNCLSQLAPLGESLSMTHCGQRWTPSWAPHLKKQKCLRRSSFKTKGISSCAMKPALGWQPTHSLLPEVTHACHKSGSFHQGAQGVTSHRLGCRQCQGQGLWIQAAPLTQICHSQQEKGQTQSCVPWHITSQHLPLSLQRQNGTQTKDFFPNPAIFQVQESLCIISLRTQPVASWCWRSAMRGRNADHSWFLRNVTLIHGLTHRVKNSRMHQMWEMRL